ncbi:hypothetical protein GGR57DRAFT_493096 [Xylariaceae sp. FL1272]|nr:hypothetical protein GGR57DRAFT_493096 [Xylariaceae sp. FL1272]
MTSPVLRLGISGTRTGPYEIQGKESLRPYPSPKPTPNIEHCTTWPVNKEGDYDAHSVNRSAPVRLDSLAPHGGWKKPDGVKIVALVFYGRKRYVDILDCYLQRNLKFNGGYLDEVWFMAHTEDADDVAWLDGLVLKTPEYKIVGRGDCESKRYDCLWKYATEDKTIYIKIDDDIIYIHPDAIPQLVHTRLAVPHAYAVSAQLINSPITGLEQYHHTAIYPFVPDPKAKPNHKVSETWRLSKQQKFPKESWPVLARKNDHDIMYPPVPYRGHPFMLLSEDNFDNLHTPMGRYDQEPGGDNIAFSPLWKSWAMAAQQQYSLLYNLEKNQLSRYFYGTRVTYPSNAKGPNAMAIMPAPNRAGEPTIGGEQILDTQFRRYNLNFVAVWGSDIRDHLPIAEDDEQDITKTIPRKTGRPFIIDTRALVTHFSFFTQIDGIRQTDLLDRWRAYANEVVCEIDNLKKPWDLRCPEFDEERIADQG